MLFARRMFHFSSSIILGVPTLYQQEAWRCCGRRFLAWETFSLHGTKHCISVISRVKSYLRQPAPSYMWKPVYHLGWTQHGVYFPGKRKGFVVSIRNLAGLSTSNASLTQPAGISYLAIFVQMCDYVYSGTSLPFLYSFQTKCTFLKVQPFAYNSSM